MESILSKTTRNFSKTNENIQKITIALIALIVPTFLAQLINIIFGLYQLNAG